MIKPFGQMELSKRIKLNKGTEFFPATSQEIRSDILHGIKVKHCDQTRGKMKKKKLGTTEFI